MLAALAALTTLVLLFHRRIPNTPGRLGSLVESFLPWCWLVLVVLFGLALLRRAPLAMLTLLVPTAVWAHQYGVLLPEPRSDGHDLVVVQHNVSDENTDPRGTASELSAAFPDLIALEELLPKARAVYERGLAGSHPHHAVVGTVGLWSKYPLTGVRAADIKPAGITEPWNRGLRAVVEAPQRDIAVYVAHLPSIRIGASGLASRWRDESARKLGAEVAAEKTDTVLVLGDFNGTVDDRGLTPLTSQLDVPDRGLAFSYPAAFPVARIDQIMARSANVGRIRPLPSTGSDHLPVRARIALDPLSAAPSASPGRSTR
ncbi:endonuclease/exonuclease/phosphatase family protein [Streptomyces endophyticus]|uniref:Endonuclease/exonuclease/phosphatase family protein n=1 Tax=Streptomyces endophyticus TaxID=714166 RepID=A0ABU6FJW8_9ACTN|nr:endonuclease/exonuclease/phosphatase family protein [Streptomyces endophyticus]